MTLVTTALLRSKQEAPPKVNAQIQVRGVNFPIERCCWGAVYLFRACTEAGNIAAHSKKRIRRREGQVWTHIKKKRRFNLFNRRPRSPNLAPPCELDGQKDETSLQESPSDDSEVDTVCALRFAYVCVHACVCLCMCACMCVLVCVSDV